MSEETQPGVLSSGEVQGSEGEDATPSPHKEDQSDLDFSLNHSGHESDNVSTSHVLVVNRSRQSPGEEGHESGHYRQENQTLQEPELNWHLPESSKFGPRPIRKDRGLLPDGVEWIDDDQMERRGVWDGLVFSLGWGPSGRFGIDVGFAASDNPGGEK